MTTSPPATILALMVLTETDEWLSIQDMRSRIEARTGRSVNERTLASAVNRCTVDNLEERWVSDGAQYREYRLDA